MNIVLVAVNSKYVHSNLAVRSIKQYASVHYGIECEIAEYSINEEFSKMLSDLYSKKPDIAAFSCYIWNIGMVERLCKALKKVLPKTVIVLGGAEVSYTDTHIDYADYIIKGEGEESFSRWVLGLERGCNYSNIMDRLVFPYTQDELKQKGKIFYYEASRGCPYGCTYCLSGENRAVRNRSLDLVKADILKFISAGVMLVKFIDRTSNCDMGRFKEILRFIYSQNTKTKFHFEINSSLMDDEAIEIISHFGEGQLRFEAGMQSANPKTLEVVGRNADVKPVLKGVGKLVNKTGSIVHLDLIAGLPYEDFNSFAMSFNTAFEVRPHELQLGFLKLLHGAKITSQAEKFEYKYCDFPPYEVLSSKWMDYADIKRLKAVEEVLELYYNSGVFTNALPNIIQKFESPFAFFDALGNNFEQKLLFRMPHSRESLYSLLFNFCIELGMNDNNIKENIVKDFMLNLRDVALPKWAEGEKDADFASKCKRLFESSSEINNLLKSMKDLNPRERHKRIRVEKACNKVWLIDYIDKKIIDITLYFG